MSAVETRFLEPLDVLFLRGNKLFGDPGSHGESLVPPWPSVAAGALRSRMLADAGVDLAAFARGEVEHPALGTPDKPGAFAVAAFHLARRSTDGAVELLFAPPADLVITEDAQGEPGAQRLAPMPPAHAVSSSAPLPLLPVLGEAARRKPVAGYWLSEAGWRHYLAGHMPPPAELIKSSKLWALDHRVGVGLDTATRRAADRRLFSMQAVAMQPGVGFFVAISGADAPAGGSVRLGGDGRAAAVARIRHALPEPDYGAIAQARRCRMVLTTPGIFAKGWLPHGAGERNDDGTVRFALHGVRGRVVCAAVPRAETVSGWDLARRQPKPAQRVAPAGSVYWLELDDGVSPDALRKLVEAGLWGEPCEDVSRRAEGFNRITLAAY